MKFRVHQLRDKLNVTKKEIRSIFEFLFRIRAISDALLAVGEPISERDKIDSILQGLLKEYSPFIMMVYGKLEPPTLYEIDAFLYVQKAHLDKYRQELSIANGTTKPPEVVLNITKV